MSYIFDGFLVNLLFTIVSSCLGFCFSLPLSISSFIKNPLYFLSNIFISIVRGVPLFIQALFFTLILPSYVKLPLETLLIICFAINSSAYFALLLKNVFENLPLHWWQMGKILGISKNKLFLRIILPYCLRRSRKLFINEFLNLFKETAIISSFGMKDMIFKAKELGMQKYNYLQPLLFTGFLSYVFFFLMEVIFACKNKEDDKQMSF